MTVWVVMSNDFPDCVFADQMAARAYCKTKNDEAREARKPFQARIYYTPYRFEVKR